MLIGMVAAQRFETVPPSMWAAKLCYVQVDSAGRFRRLVGCALCTEFTIGSRSSLSPKERVAISRVSTVGLPSSDSAS